jgi:hypothetical protein
MTNMTSVLHESDMLCQRERDSSDAWRESYMLGERAHSHDSRGSIPKDISVKGRSPKDISVRGSSPKELPVRGSIPDEKLPYPLISKGER